MSQTAGSRGWAPFTLAVLTLALSASVPALAAPLKVAVSLSDVVPIVQAVGGSLVQATEIMPAGADPHSFTITAQIQSDLATADLIVYARTEFLEFENTIKQALPDKPSVDWPDYEPFGAKFKDFEGNPGNPHGFWLDHENAIAMAKGIADRLKKAGLDAAAIDANLDRFVLEVEAMRETSRELVREAGLEGKSVVATLACIAYIVENTGLKVGQILLQEGGGALSGQELKATVDGLRSGRFIGIVCPLSMKDAKPGEVARQLASESGARVIYVKFLSGGEKTDTYLAQGYFNAAALAAPLPPSGATKPEAGRTPVGSTGSPPPEAPAGLYVILYVLTALVILLLVLLLKARSSGGGPSGGAGIFD
ncbi:MAG: zinc ABC transporter substrate-binding protein [Armatimonadetes bacterium]|nr:zinc ABC transporter substrate-binding protein [Armatimonadota bacterium]